MYRFIEHEITGLFLGIKHDSQEPGADVIISDSWGYIDHQQWEITAEGMIINKLNGLALTIHPTDDPPAKVTMERATGADVQRWYYENNIRQFLNQVDQFALCPRQSDDGMVPIVEAVPSSPLIFNLWRSFFTHKY
ncbi:MAG: RICIN domain-containing protein [Ardenticatenaceae bacterium]